LRLVFTRQHDDPMLTIPAGIKLDAAEREICISNLLASVFVDVAVFIDHQRPALLQLEFNKHEPVLGANFIKVAGVWTSHGPVDSSAL
jgi:hypothetical protein